MLNQGLTGPEIAEVIELPPALEDAWHAHGYYGSVSHDVKAVHQRERPRCWREQVNLDIDRTDTAARHRTRLRNGALTHTAAVQTTC
jgi:alkyl sulfatase BDS1-like metallo-beta-lactamase superfamily hydrolase